MFVVACEFRLDVELDVDGDAGFEEAIDAAVIFNGGDCHRNGVGVFALKDKEAEPSVGIVENSSAGAAAIATVAARSDRRNGVFRGQEASDFFAEGLAFEKSSEREAVSPKRVG